MDEKSVYVIDMGALDPGTNLSLTDKSGLLHHWRDQSPGMFALHQVDALTANVDTHISPLHVCVSL